MTSRSKLFALLLLAATVGCQYDKPSNSARKLNEQYLYLRDATGRCISIATTIDTYGANIAQSGELKVFLMDTCPTTSDQITVILP